MLCDLTWVSVRARTHWHGRVSWPGSGLSHSHLPAHHHLGHADGVKDSLARAPL